MQYCHCHTSHVSEWEHDGFNVYIKLIKKATESAQPVWELDVQQRNYFVLITIVSMYGISNTSHQIRYKIVWNKQKTSSLNIQNPGLLTSMTSRFVSNSDVKREWCQGLRFHVTRQEFTSVRTLVQELRFFIYQVLTSQVVKFFG